MYISISKCSSLTWDAGEYQTEEENILPATNTVDDEQTAKGGDKVYGATDSREQPAHLLVEPDILV